MAKITEIMIQANDSDYSLALDLMGGYHTLNLEDRAITLDTHDLMNLKELISFGSHFTEYADYRIDELQNLVKADREQVIAEFGEW